MTLISLSSNILFVAIFLTNFVSSKAELKSKLPEECSDYQVLSESRRNVGLAAGYSAKMNWDSDNLDCQINTWDWKGPGIYRMS